MDLFAQRISDPSQLDYCPAEDFVREVGEPRLVDVVAGRLHDVTLYQLLGWATSLVVAVLTMVCLVCKVYSRLTVGTCTSNKDMTGRTVLITGANAGIGKETAKEMARRNARVILACRNPEKAAAAAKEILEETGRHVVVRKLDLCSFKSIREFADDIVNTEERLDVLINNAGIVPFPHRVETVDGFEQTLQTNHLGPFLLTNLLLGKLKASAPSRIITLSSLLHHFGRIDPGRLDYAEYRMPMQVYSDTKLANVLFTKELARRLLGTGVTANVLHPGAVQTDINSTYVGFMNIVMNALFYFFGKTPKEGAQTSVYLAVSDEVAKVTGQYFMDCRRSLPSRNAEDPALARRLWDVSEKLTGLSI
ncbi:hypothetical protein HPB49_019910 [Dermacentor silvarum]|uniref:Uncharacterized protein n=1 Tax=Dermacentor silvarum TaxID=543639 RepID=A0ACB8CH95_DERSI|nr:retinol dehydrogenase 11 [Dermacentor silvarum]KAH7942033.1 hypothetical protein HPB49_019910 [Dermacentor silvarum]